MRQEIGLPRDTIVVEVEECFDVCVTESTSEQLAAEERWIPHDELGVGPAGFLGLRWIGHVEQSVAVLDVVEGFEDRVASIAQAVADHPLDLADPDGHAGELGGVGVEFDAEDDLWTDVRELLWRLEDERAPHDGLPLEVLECPQAEDQEVTRAARGIEHAHTPEPIEEGAEDCLRFSSGRVALVTFLPDRSSIPTVVCISAYSRRSGRMMTGVRRGPKWRRGRCSARRAGRVARDPGRARTGCRRSRAR